MIKEIKFIVLDVSLQEWLYFSVEGIPKEKEILVDSLRFT